MKYTNKSLLDAEETIIAHGVNTKGTFASGVAKQIAEEWPRAKIAYDYAYASSGMYLGSVHWVAIDGTEKQWLAHVSTQTSYGREPHIRYVSYDAVDKGLRRVVEDAKERGLMRKSWSAIAIPMIGAGLGNGDWGVITHIIQKIELDLSVQFNVYVPDEAQFKELTGE